MNWNKLVVLVVFQIVCCHTASTQDLLKSLQKKFGYENVEKVENSAFAEYYEISFMQPIDHTDTTKGLFRQVVLLGHNDVKKPMIIETNGYEILPYQDSLYISEPAKIFSGNQLIVEHRYFGQSIPDSINNDYLAFAQIAADYHNIKRSLSDIYTSEWISTGASKGGLTSLTYSYYYPDDVAASFVYVAPVVESLEDERITSFLREKRSTETGKHIFEIQKDLLDRKQVLLPVFLEALKLSGMEIGDMDPETLYDFGVLEFDFNYWQYIGDLAMLKDYSKSSIDDMAGRGLQNTTVLVTESDSMVAVLPMCTWFYLDDAISEPFFYQSFTQMGTYGYDEELFKGLKQTTYSPEFLAGEHPAYSVEYMKAFDAFLEKELKHAILVYGADDPWTACKPDIPSVSDNLVIINPGTNHSTQIQDLSDEDKQKVRKKLKGWVKSKAVVE